MDTTLSRNAADRQRDGKFAPLAPETLTNAEELLAKLAQGAAATTTNRPVAEADFTAGPRLAAPTPDTAPLPDLTPLPNVVPPPDIALHDMAPRPLGHAQATGKRKSRGRRAMSGLFRLLLAGCIGVVATLAWQSYGAAGRRTIASFISKPGLSSSPDMTQPSPGAANQDPGAAVEANAADGAPAPVAALAQTTPHPVMTPAPATADVSGQIEALAQDITAMRQSLEQLTAAQSEMARSIAALPAAEDARREQPASAPPAAVQPASAPPASAPRRPTAARKPTPPPQRASQPLAPGPRPLSQSVATTPPPPPATSPAASTPRASAPAPLPAEPQPPRPPGSMP